MNHFKATENTENHSQSEEKATKPKGKVRAVLLSVLALVLVLAVAAAGILIWYTGTLRDGMFSSRGSVSDTLPTEVAASTEPAASEASVRADWIDRNGNRYLYREDVISILLMGIDYMKDEQNWDEEMAFNGGNADVIALVILDTSTFDFTILYIPRDTMVDVIALDAQGNYIDTVFTNLSAAHSYGDGGSLSCQIATDAVSRLLMGVPVNRYAALDYEALYTLNEMVGGVQITFDQDYRDIRWSFTAGSTATLDNQDLSKFVTYRGEEEVEGAYNRGMRSMVVLKALFDQCKDAIAADPTVAIEMFNGLAENLSTDLSLTEITYLARNIGKMSFTSETVVRLPGETTMGEKYVEFHPDEAWLDDFIAETFCTPLE